MKVNMAIVEGKLNGKKIVPWIWVASIGVPLVVGVLVNPSMENLFDFPEPFVEMARNLPFVNATINSLVSILLVLGIVFIKNGKRKQHQIAMLSAFGLSALFLVTYITYHLSVGHVGHCDANLAPKWLYLTILISHIVLSGTIVPLASFSIFRALNETYDRHKKLARITFPLWLYVSVTGVIVVWLNSGCY